LADYYTQLAQQESARGLPGFAVLHGLRPHLLAVQSHCLAAGQHAATQQLTWAIGTHDGYLALQGLNTEWTTLLEAGLAAARAAAHRYDERAFLNFLGLAEADVGQVKAAIVHYEDGLTLACVDKDRQSEGIYLGNLGNAFADLKELETAVGYYEEALAIAREIGNRRNEGIWLGNLGIAYKELGEVDTAVRYYEEALTIAREIGDRLGEANHAWNWGLIVEEREPARAVELMSIRVAYLQAIGHPDAEKTESRVAKIQAHLQSGT
jgi:tetratricopeptide (TPR) repeat protein